MERKNLVVLSFNVRQWSRDLNSKKPSFWKNRAKNIRTLIEKNNPDIILIQEGTFPMIGMVIPSGYKKATGCSISHHIYCRNYYRVINHEWHMRWCRATICTEQGEFLNVFSVHTHWDEDIYRKTCTEITSHLEGGMHNIAGGDWNNEPSIIKPLVHPMWVNDTKAVTFCNWESGKEAELDFFACWPQICFTSVAYQDFDLSDHLPVVLNVEPLRWSCKG